MGEKNCDTMDSRELIKTTADYVNMWKHETRWQPNYVKATTHQL